MLFFRFAHAPVNRFYHLQSLAQVKLINAFNSFFKTLVDHEVTVELKNDIQIRGTLKSVDQYLNIKLDDISVVEEIKYPHLVGKVVCGAGSR
jgi:small nuclear ribonucleoprotein (snRNP)-like protein